MKRFKAAVIGGSGYGGAELIRRLLMHPDVELVRVASVDHVGEALSSAHPNMEGRTALRFENLAPAAAAEGCDVVLLGLPHKVSAQKVPELLPTGVKIVDMSGDFRLRDAAAYARYYGGAHPHPELLGTFVYGLPELNREAIKRARHVAAPGCFATTVALGLIPVARGGLVAGTVHVVGITGSSGSGIEPRATTHHPVRASNLRTYKPLDHQHVPEIEATVTQAGARDLALRFVPVSAPLVRGIFATSFLEVPASTTKGEVADMFAQAYRTEPFVRFVAKREPEVVAVAGSNHAEVGFALGDPHGGTRTLSLFSVTDNLIKGGAGQAIQAMNLVLGVPETRSLEDVGPWP